MATADYRIESDHPILSRWLPADRAASPASAEQPLSVNDRALAVAIAAKSETQPPGEEIRVVHAPTGEVVFRKAAAEERAAATDEL